MCRKWRIHFQLWKIGNFIVIIRRLWVHTFTGLEYFEFLPFFFSRLLCCFISTRCLVDLSTSQRIPNSFRTFIWFNRSVAAAAAATTVAALLYLFFIFVYRKLIFNKSCSYVDDAREYTFAFLTDWLTVSATHASHHMNSKSRRVKMKKRQNENEKRRKKRNRNRFKSLKCNELYV